MLFLRNRNFVKLILACLTVYFFVHLIYGSRGLIAYFRIKQEIYEARKQLITLKSNVVSIENRSSLLRPDSLDMDMLDEKSREILGFSKEEENVFILNKLIE